MIAAAPPVHPAMATIEDYSIAERLRRGEVVLIHDAERDLDPRRPGDRRIIESGGRSILAVPLFFGERVGSCLVFRSSRVHWFDETDVDVAGAIAAPLALAIQHQQLAEEERRLAAVAHRARTLEKSLKRARRDCTTGMDSSRPSAARPRCARRSPARPRWRGPK